MQTEETTIDEGVLDFSIETASSTVLRVLLRSICETIPEAKTKVVQHLLVAKNLVPVVPTKDPLSYHSDLDEDSESDTESNSESDTESKPDTRAPAQLLGKRPRYSKCKNCEKEFDVLENSKKACRYHPACALADEDSRLFVDNDMFGPNEADLDPDMKKKYPDCFVYECCDATMEENPDGCETAWHREAVSTISLINEHIARKQRR
ncbi:hypothetical protein N7520_009835 [Penicillium odoratum]|uniref:uncharacterized protein n=1 Tax=Penicillium odoratum TaxID=1167516 RepID=UPI002548BAF1|nr:uncharacterized protein N7520_009835 [Penicillium odoratum]KAJ5752918.1 hypothetical protein N7520_009835 [Penicillium odoratum]